MNKTAVSIDDRTPTQADFTYNAHASMLQDQHILATSNANFPDYGAAGNAHDSATIPQYDPSAYTRVSSPQYDPSTLQQSSPHYDPSTLPHSSPDYNPSTLPQPSESSFPFFHDLPLQQVAHSLPSIIESMTLDSAQGPDSLQFYDELSYPPISAPAASSPISASNDTTNLAQWEQADIKHDSLFASVLEDATAQFVTAAPFNDFLGAAGEFKLTPLCQLFFDHENRSNPSPVPSEMEGLQDSFIASASLEATPFWVDTIDCI